jgi:hypothetical protein
LVVPITSLDFENRTISPPCNILNEKKSFPEPGRGFSRSPEFRGRRAIALASEGDGPRFRNAKNKNGVDSPCQTEKSDAVVRFIRDAATPLWRIPRNQSWTLYLV